LGPLCAMMMRSSIRNWRYKRVKMQEFVLEERTKAGSDRRAEANKSGERKGEACKRLHSSTSLCVIRRDRMNTSLPQLSASRRGRLARVLFERTIRAPPPSSHNINRLRHSSGKPARASLSSDSRRLRITHEELSNVRLRHFTLRVVCLNSHSKFAP